MHYQNAHQLMQDKRLRQLIRKKQRLSFLFALTIIVLFFGYILVIAFTPGAFSVGLAAGGVINLYLLVSVGLIILICILMNVFIALKARDSHEDIHELVRQFKKEDT
jgi:uncharacterized membrane protein (DUF485 family)